MSIRQIFMKKTTTRVRFYKDNVFQWESDLAGTLGHIKGKPWTIGQEWDGSSTSSFAKAAIDEVAFYDHILTKNEINKLYTNSV